MVNLEIVRNFEQSVDDRVKDGKRGGEYAMTL